MSDDVAIREAARSDLAALAALALEAAAEEAALRPNDKPTLVLEAAQSSIEAALFGPRPAATGWIAARGPELLGAAYVCELFPGDGLRRGWFLKDIYVAAAHRGHGVGGALITALVDAARAAGADRLELHTHPSNTGARRLYERLGFSEPPRCVYRVAP